MSVDLDALERDARTLHRHVPLAERFWARVAKSDGCWEWTGTKSTAGYGRISLGGRNLQAHRVSLELATGKPVPSDLVVDHLCCNKLCVRPDHLEAVTSGENSRRWSMTITHCVNGHEYTSDNTRVGPDGHKVCRECHRQHAKEYGPYPGKTEAANARRAERRALGLCTRCGASDPIGALCRDCRDRAARNERNRYARTQRVPCREGGVSVANRGTYVASRTHHAQMWHRVRADGWRITATWIDEAGPGQATDLGALWSRIRREVTSSERVVLYAEAADFPLKGALVEAGMALAALIPIYVVLPGVVLDPTSCRPIGSWIREPLVRVVDSIDEAMEGADLCM